MQLEGSVFGLLLIELKPQLEKLLALPQDALTKEIALTQKLLELFIDYQVRVTSFASLGPGLRTLLPPHRPTTWVPADGTICTLPDPA